jgi:hypothetical protein
MGYITYRDEQVWVHMDFYDRAFRFLIWICEYKDYLGPVFYINVPYIGFNKYDFKYCLKNRKFKNILSLNYFYITYYEKSITPGPYHIVWFAFNRWFKKQRKN